MVNKKLDVVRRLPREIVKRIQEEYPDDMAMPISHEAIYRYIDVLPRGSLKTTFIKALRQERAYRRKRKRGKHEETRGKIAEMLSIEERPQELADCTMPGHWEGDLILGKQKRTALGTLVERTTRYTVLVPLKAKDATSVRKAYAKELRSLPREITKTLTYDQGKEMSEHKQFTIDTGIAVYLAHPGSAWERGMNGRTDGLFRQYFHECTEFDKVSAREIKRVHVSDIFRLVATSDAAADSYKTAGPSSTRGSPHFATLPLCWRCSLYAC